MSRSSMLITLSLLPVFFSVAHSGFSVTFGSGSPMSNHLMASSFFFQSPAMANSSTDMLANAKCCLFRCRKDPTCLACVVINDTCKLGRCDDLTADGALERHSRVQLPTEYIDLHMMGEPNATETARSIIRKLCGWVAPTTTTTIVPSTTETTTSSTTLSPETTTPVATTTLSTVGTSSTTTAAPSSTSTTEPSTTTTTEMSTTESTTTEATSTTTTSVPTTETTEPTTPSIPLGELLNDDALRLLCRTTFSEGIQYIRGKTEIDLSEAVLRINSLGKFIPFHKKNVVKSTCSEPKCLSALTRVRLDSMIWKLQVEAFDVSQSQIGSIDKILGFVASMPGCCGATVSINEHSTPYNAGISKFDYNSSEATSTQWTTRHAVFFIWP